MIEMVLVPWFMVGLFMLLCIGIANGITHTLDDMSEREELFTVIAIVVLGPPALIGWTVKEFVVFMYRVVISRRST
jgi:uncharacterized membrane protein